VNVFEAERVATGTSQNGLCVFACEQRKIFGLCFQIVGILIFFLYFFFENISLYFGTIF
jgi:hypothetical protein